MITVAALRAALADVPGEYLVFGELDYEWVESVKVSRPFESDEFPLAVVLA